MLREAMLSRCLGCCCAGGGAPALAAATRAPAASAAPSSLLPARLCQLLLREWAALE
jgi:hypothetical protein